MTVSFKKTYARSLDVFIRYWRLYGGIYALVRSPYLHASLVLTLLTTPIWSTTGWWNMTLSVMPNILGFSLGGFAIFMALGDENFRKLISGSENEEKSPFMTLSSAFVHFIVLQILSIITSLLSQAASPALVHGYWVVYFLWALSYLLFVYAILSALAATMALFRISSSYDAYQEVNKKGRQAGRRKKPSNDS